MPYLTCIFPLDRAVEKPMDVYGDRWYDHWRRLERNWKKDVGHKDTVIVPGDISWGLKLDEAKSDLRLGGQTART